MGPSADQPQKSGRTRSRLEPLSLNAGFAADGE